MISYLTNLLNFYTHLNMNETKVSLKITAFAFGGDGIAFLPDGRICFVARGIPGDIAEVVITQEKKNFARAEILSLQEKSPYRVEPFCPLRKSEPYCPGCVYAETTPEFEQETKQKQYRDFLQRGGKAKDCRFEPPFLSPLHTGYRTRISLSCENGQAEYRAADNRTLIPVKACPLACESINHALSSLPPPDPAVHRVQLRAVKDGKVLCKSLPYSSRYKEQLIMEDLEEYGTFSTPSGSFFQVNLPVAKGMIAHILNHIEHLHPEYLLDLYCGSGFFSVVAAERFPKLHITGVELDSAAVRAARLNAAARTPGADCRFICCKAEKLELERIHADPEKSLVLLDPPRTGIDRELAEKLKAWAPKYILYISCAPDMLRRDLDRLDTAYSVREGRMYDMFPATAHFESITLLVKI